MACTDPEFLKSDSEDYRLAIGLHKNTKNDDIEKSLNRAHEIRKFEIELYWKRANYFWILQAAVFTAFGLLITSDEPNKIPNFLPFSIVCLGFLCAYAGYLSAEGSKFWQKNWEKHIDMLECKIEGKLHKTIWIGGSGVKHSVSRVNSKLILCFVWLWFIIAAYLYTTLMLKNPLALEFEACWSWTCKIDPNPIMATLSILLTLLAYIIIRSQWTEFNKIKKKSDSKNILIKLFNYLFQKYCTFRRPYLKPKQWLKRQQITGEDQ